MHVAEIIVDFVHVGVADIMPTLPPELPYEDTNVRPLTKPSSPRGGKNENTVSKRFLTLSLSLFLSSGGGGGGLGASEWRASAAGP